MLSVIVITKNEAAHVERCLASVAWADEIIVLDSGSTDGTVDICRRYTPHVFQTDWPGFGPQKQRALDKAKGDWVLSVDADEVVDAGLKQEIETAIASSRFFGYEIPRLSEYCGRQMKHGGWWPDYVLRLFRRGQARFSDDLVHERVIVQGEIGRLGSPLQHETYVNLDEMLQKMNSYSSLGAEKLYHGRRRSSLAKAILKGGWAFIRTYLIQASVLDGPQGFMLAVSNAEVTYYKYLKLWELHARGKGPQ